MEIVFPIFQSEGTSLDCHYFSHMMENGLAISSASSFRTRGCPSSAPMDLCTFRFLRSSRTWSSPTAGHSSVSSSLPVPPLTWVLWLERLPGEDWDNKLFKYLSLLHIQDKQVSCFLPKRAHIIPSLSFITDVPIEAWVLNMRLKS